MRGVINSISSNGLGYQKAFEEVFGKVLPKVFRKDLPEDIPEGIPKDLPESVSSEQRTVNSSSEQLPTHSSQSENLNSGGGSSAREEKKTTTTDFIILQDEIKKTTGFIIDEKILWRFKNLNLSPEESTGSHNFFAYAKEVVEKKYPGKTTAELRTLFISAVATWENLREEYPIWKGKKLKADMVSAVKKAKTTPPERCDCGGTIKVFTGRHVCEKCKIAWIFENGAWGKLENNEEAHIDLTAIRHGATEKQPEVEAVAVSDDFIPQEF